MMESPGVRAVEAAMDPSWEDEEEEDEEETEEVVGQRGRRPAASAVMAVPAPGGKGSLRCGRREGDPETSHSLSEAREAGQVQLQL